MKKEKPINEVVKVNWKKAVPFLVGIVLSIIIAVIIKLS